MDKQIFEKRFNQVIEIAKKYLTADDYLINFSINQNALTRFANNMVTQNIDVSSEDLNITCYFDNKKATLNTANINEEGIKKLIENCENAAKNSVADK